MKLFLIVLLALPQGLLPRATEGTVPVTVGQTVVIPGNGIADFLLTEKDHPSGYVKRPGCWAMEFGMQQHVIKFENDDKSIKITQAHPGAIIQWECHGFMQKNTYEICLDKYKHDAEGIKTCKPLQVHKSKYELCLEKGGTPEFCRPLFTQN